MMTIPKKVKGIVLVTGKTNVGKTSFGFHTGYPLKDTHYYSFDAKKPSVGDDPAKVFGFYREYLGIMAQKKELAMIEAFLNDVEANRNKKAKVAVIDAEEVMRRNFAIYTQKHKTQLRDYWYGRGGKWQSYEELGFAKKFEASYFASLQEFYDLVIIINHLEDVRDQDAESDEKPLVPGKKRADTKEPLIQKAALRLWLVPTDGHLCPSAIVLKNPGFHRIDEKTGMVQTMTLFPPKLSPYALPDWDKRPFISVWDVIRFYEENPFSLKYPKVESHEMLTDDERHMVSEDLTDSDRRLIEQFALIAAKENHERTVVQVQKVLAEKPNAPTPFVASRVRLALPDLTITNESIQAIVDELGE